MYHDEQGVPVYPVSFCALYIFWGFWFEIWAIFGSSFGLFDWCLCFFRHPSLSLVPFIPDQPPTFRSKNLFSRGKKHLLILFLLRSFWVSLTRANYYIYAPFCLLSWEGVLFFGGCFLSNWLKKDLSVKKKGVLL